MVEHDIIVFRFLLEARSYVDYISNRSVVLNTIARTDVSHHRLASIHTYSKWVKRVLRLSSLIFQYRQTHLPCSAYCTQHVIFLRQRRIENRHKRISPESGHGSFFIPYLFDQNFKISIEQVHHFFGRFTFVQAGKVTKIGSDNRNFFCFPTQVQRVRILDELLHHIGMNEATKNATYIFGFGLGSLEFGTVIYDKRHAYRDVLRTVTQRRDIERQINPATSCNFTFDGIGHNGAMAMLHTGVF